MSLRKNGLLQLSRILGLLLTAPACVDSDGNDDRNSAGASNDITTSEIRSKQELFEQDMLFIRVRGWDPNKMSPQALNGETSVANAELLVFKTGTKETRHCPDPDGERGLVFKTKAFSVRTSGNKTNGTPKSSYKLSLDEKEDRLFGMKALNLKSMWNDVSQMREAVAWKLFAEAGVVAPRHTYAKLCINDKYYGLYSVVEQVDKTLLKDHFGAKNDKGNLYKAYWSPEDVGAATLAYRKNSSDGDDGGKQYFTQPDIEQRTYRLKTNENEPASATYDDLATLVRVINGVTVSATVTGGDEAKKFDTPEYEQAVRGILNVDQFLRWAALNSLLGAWDNYHATPANYYLYNSGRRDVSQDFMTRPYFTWIPWDYDNTLGIDFFGTKWWEADVLDWGDYQGKSNLKNLPLLRHVLKNKKLLAYYIDALEHFNGTLLTEQHVMELVSKLRPRIERAAMLEGNFGDAAHTGRQFTNDEVMRNGFDHHELRRGSTFVLGIQHFVRLRHQNVAGQIARIRSERGVAKGSSGATFPVKPEGALP